MVDKLDMKMVIKGLECRKYNLSDKDCEHCIYGIKMGRRWGCDFIGLCEDALELLKAKANDIDYVTGERFKKWAENVGAHFCATCKRRDCDCPIENEYALPLDGYCHLWNGRPTE